LYEENLIPAVMAQRRTHPDLYDRLIAAGVQPDYPRPQKASNMAPQALIFSILLGFLIVANFQPRIQPHGYSPPQEDSTFLNEEDTNSSPKFIP
jgi:hypothetical protein